MGRRVKTKKRGRPVLGSITLYDKKTGEARVFQPTDANRQLKEGNYVLEPPGIEAKATKNIEQPPIKSRDTKTTAAPQAKQAKPALTDAEKIFVEEMTARGAEVTVTEAAPNTSPLKNPRGQTTTKRGTK